LIESIQNGWAVAGAGRPTRSLRDLLSAEKLSGKKNLVRDAQAALSEAYAGEIQVIRWAAPPPPATQPTPAEREKFFLTKYGVGEVG
jgi:hypothetical protein